MFEVRVMHRNGSIMFVLKVDASALNDLGLLLECDENGWFVKFADLATDLMRFYNEEY